MKLYFEDSTPRGGCHCPSYEEAAEYRGYKIRAVQDTDASNPFTDWDCEPPILVHTDRSITEYGLDHAAPALTRDEIKANAGEVAQFLGAATLLRAVRDYIAPRADAVDLVNEAITAKVEDAGKTDSLDLIGEVWGWKGAAWVSVSRHGYSQSCWAEILVVATPEWCAKIGCTEPPSQKSLEATADLYAAWAYGDTFGYVIEDPEGEEIDSCWGFYGSDHEASGLSEQARDAIDHEITRRANTRAKQVKTWIRHHVPLEARL